MSPLWSRSVIEVGNKSRNRIPEDGDEVKLGMRVYQSGGYQGPEFELTRPHGRERLGAKAAQ
jgi:hypothetical protein